MAVAEQFAGLQMDMLIGAPLTAAADASVQLANSTADFINKVGFDNEGNVRKVAFGYQKLSMNEDGTSNLDDLKVDVPILAIVPIPNLQVDEVNILFDMEVKESVKSESSTDVGSSFSASAGFWAVKARVSGSVSAHNSNTRSTDNSAKYHVDVRATNHGTPEGLARVLDMIAANVAPALVGSTLKDENGGELSTEAKKRAEGLKTLRMQISQLEKRVLAAQEGFDDRIAILKDIAMSQLNVYHGLAEKGETDGAKEAINKGMAEVDQAWNDFFGRASSLVEIIAESSDENKGEQKISKILGLKAIDAQGNVKDYADAKEAEKYNAIYQAQNTAVGARKNLGTTKEELLAKKAEYSAMLSGNTGAAQPQGKSSEDTEKKQS